MSQIHLFYFIMKILLLTLLILILSFAETRAIENHSAGARSRALSDAFVSVSDIWSTFHNQAGIADWKNISAGFYYESRYMVEELSLATGTVLLPVNRGSFGISFYQFGKGPFKENKYALAYALPLTDKLKVAVQFDYFSDRFPENERSKGFVTFETGIIYRPAKTLYLGAHIFNPIHAGVETIQGKEKMPTTFRFGGHYQFAEMVMVILEAQKSSETDVIVKSGIEFSPAKNLALRFGVSGKPVNYTAGIGYTIGKLTTDISFGYHGNLGITPAVSLQFAF